MRQLTDLDIQLENHSEITNEAEPLRNCNSGTVTIGFLLMAMTLYVCVAGVWNTGAMIDQKIQSQVAADAAAHSAATEMSSTINQVAMLNMLILRAQSACVIYEACIAATIVGTIVAVIEFVVNMVRWIISLIPKPLPTPDPDALRRAVSALKDLSVIIAFASHYLQTDIAGIYRVISDCKSEQTRLVDELPNRVKEQTAAIEEYLPHPGGRQQFKINVSHPEASWYPESNGTGRILRRSYYPERLIMLYIRVLLTDMQWATADNAYEPPEPEDSWRMPGLKGLPSQAFFEQFLLQTVKNGFRIAWYLTLVLSPPLHSIDNWGYELYTKTFIEWAGNNTDRSRLMVIAAVERIHSTNTFMARGFFKPVNDGNSVLAVSQAETQNVYSDLLDSLFGNIPGVREMLGLLPWRMWSSMGACWQSRLIQVDTEVLRRSLEKNDHMKRAWKNNTSQEPNDLLNKDKNTNVILH